MINQWECVPFGKVGRCVSFVLFTTLQVNGWGEVGTCSIFFLESSDWPRVTYPPLTKVINIASFRSFHSCTALGKHMQHAAGVKACRKSRIP